MVPGAIPAAPTLRNRGRGGEANIVVVMGSRNERGRAENTAGAWAAAAVVLALGALGFAVAGQFELQDLAARMDRMQASPPVSPTTTGAPPDALGVPAGSSEPASPAETAAVKAAFASLYDGSQPIEARMQFIDDPGGVLDAISAAGALFAQEVSALRATVSRVVFTSTVTATVAYALQANGAEALQRLGSARLVDGVWKVSRATVCADLEMAGARCVG